jgi:heme A synthase
MRASRGSSRCRPGRNRLPGVNQVHRIVGYSIPAGFLLLALWALVAFVRNRNPGGGFWNLLAVLQVVIAIQFVVGSIMFLSGRRAGHSRT